MDQMWNTTIGEGILIWLFMICFCVMLGLFLFTILKTILALLGQYSKAAVALDWGFAAVSFFVHLMDYSFEAMLLFVYGSPFIALAMKLLARNYRTIEEELS